MFRNVLNFDHVVKPKCVRERADFFNFQNFVYTFPLFVYNFLNCLPPLNHILALPTWGHKCTVTELQAFEIPKFQTKHPVESFFQNKDIHLEYSNWIHFSISR